MVDIKKVEKVPPKIKIIKEGEDHDEESELEEELEESGEEQFKSFVSQGRRRAPVIVPVLESGQAPQNIPTAPRQASSQRTRTESTDEQFYRMKQEVKEGAKKYQAAIMQQDVKSTQQRVLEKSRDLSMASQRQSQIAPQNLADEERENKYKSSQETKKRRYAWEA